VVFPVFDFQGSFLTSEFWFPKVQKEKRLTKMTSPKGSPKTNGLSFGAFSANQASSVPLSKTECGRKHGRGQLDLLSRL